MQNTLNSDLFFILLALIVTALLGFLIGWLMRSVKLNALKKSLNACYKNNEDLKKELKDKSGNIAYKAPQKTVVTSPVIEKKEEVKDTNIKVASTYKSTTPNTTSSNFNKETAKKALGKTIKENDLKIVEGIGPKIEEIFNADGITTWRQLGNAPVSRLQKILNEAGDRFSFHKPDTWPKQSLLAAEGKWEELKKLQEYLDGGKEPT